MTNTPDTLACLEHRIEFKTEDEYHAHFQEIHGAPNDIEEEFKVEFKEMLYHLGICSAFEAPNPEKKLLAFIKKVQEKPCDKPCICATCLDNVSPMISKIKEKERDMYIQELKQIERLILHGNIPINWHENIAIHDHIGNIFEANRMGFLDKMEPESN